MVIRLYALLYALVMIPVVIVSFSPSYQAIYPFYQNASAYPDLIAWERLRDSILRARVSIQGCVPGWSETVGGLWSSLYYAHSLLHAAFSKDRLGEHRRHHRGHHPRIARDEIPLNLGWYSAALARRNLHGCSLALATGSPADEMVSFKAQSPDT